jgi:Zn-dependent M16 (insulinase) family peptidase
MKGAYQDSDRQLIKEINQELFKGTPYVYDSGGRPKDIVNLEYGELKKMYQYYYHPSNIAFYFYGNADLTESLNYLHREYLTHYQDESKRYGNVNLSPAPVANRHKTVVCHTA